MKYTLPLSQVVAAYGVLDGTTSEDLVIPACEHAARGILRRVRPDADVHAFESELCYAAACLAFYRRVMAECSDTISTCKAGDFTLRTNAQNAAFGAKELLRDALDTVSGCMKSVDFCFKGI